MFVVPHRARTALTLDVVLVIVFAAIGRRNHHEPLWGAPLTALPFLIGMGAAWWLIHRRSGVWPVALGPGVTVWASTVIVGVVLRAITEPLTGKGAPPSFIAVTALVLAALLLGWRLLARYAPLLPHEEADRARVDGASD